MHRPQLCFTLRRSAPVALVALAVVLATSCIKQRPIAPRPAAPEKVPETVTRMKPKSSTVAADAGFKTRPMDGVKQGGLSDAEPPDLSACSGDSDCVVVRYEHCCGSVKRGINKRHLQLYQAHNNWQVFDDNAVCGLMAPCKDDQRVTSARCASKKCVLIYP